MRRGLRGPAAEQLQTIDFRPPLSLARWRQHNTNPVSPPVNTLDAKSTASVCVLGGFRVQSRLDMGWVHPCVGSGWVESQVNLWLNFIVTLREVNCGWLSPLIVATLCLFTLLSPNYSLISMDVAINPRINYYWRLCPLLVMYCNHSIRHVLYRAANVSSLTL